MTMNSFSTFGIFLFLLFVYCTPTQGQGIAVTNVEFENGETYKSTNLIELPDGTYKIEKSGLKVEIYDIYTMFGKDVVLHTSKLSFLKMKLVNLQDARQLFDTTTRSNLGEKQYSYGLSAVYEYKKDRILENVFLTGFVKVSPAGTPQYRYVIHSGAALSSEFQPQLIWTREDFSFYVSGSNVFLVLRAKPADKTYKYYLVNFSSSSDRHGWENFQDRYFKSYVPPYTSAVYQYFSNFFDHTAGASK